MISNKLKSAVIVMIITVIVVIIALVIRYVRNEMTVYDKDGMLYEAENTSDCSQGDE